MTTLFFIAGFCVLINVVVPILIDRKLKAQRELFIKENPILDRINNAKDYLLITRDKKLDASFNYTMDEKDIIKMGVFLMNFFGQTEANMDEIKDILK